VQLVEEPPGPGYWDPAEGDWDLVLIGGEMQERCAGAVRATPGAGGIVLLNPAADAGQVADEHRRAEEKRVREFLETHVEAGGGDEPGQQPRGAGAPARTAPAPLVTAVLLNWRRPQNLAAILDCLAGQTVPVQVYLWNNGERLELEDHPAVKLVVRANRNVGCLPRWHLAGLAETEFVCSVDDDLLLADERVLEDAVRACRERCPDGIVGAFGWQHVEDEPLDSYRAHRHINGPPKRDGEWVDRTVDVVKGRFMLLRRELLERVPISPPDWPEEEPLGFRCDDLYVSMHVAGGKWGRHLVPAEIGRRWRELGQDARALAADPGHYERRGRALKLLRGRLKGEG
jgi:hypothetical protein